LLTWKNKLLPQERKRYSVQQIAEGTGRSVQDVMHALQKIGEFVDSPRKVVLEEPVRRRLCETLGVAYEAPPIPQLAPWEIKGNSLAATSAPRPNSVIRKRDARRRPRRQTERPTPLDNSGDLASLSMIEPSWNFYGFTQAERDAWQVYLSDRQAKDAHRLREVGFQPDDLGIRVSGWTVLKRLRAGEDPKAVKRLLDRHREAS
jgi:hypothetical protein